MFDYSPPHRSFMFTSLDETGYAQTIFLDTRMQLSPRMLEHVTFDAVDAAFPDRFSLPPAGYLFHTGHCGSTLISRALGVSREVLGIREPMTLRTLATTLREVNKPLGWFDEAGWERLKTILLLALERRFRPTQLPIIKCTSTCNNLAEPILNCHPERRAVFLHQSLETTLAGLFRSRRTPRDLVAQSRDRVQEWHDLTGNDDLHLATLDPEQVAVLSWLASMQRFETAQRQFPDRVLRIDFDEFLGSPDAGLQKLAAFFGLESKADKMKAAFPQIASAYSKDPSQRYSTAKRQLKLDQSRENNAGLIRSCLDMAHREIEARPEFAGLADYLGD